MLNLLNAILAKAHKSPAECQFALTQIRKHLEHNKHEGFDNLRMFINWTLHSQLDNSYVQKLLREIDSFLEEYLKDDKEIGLSDFPELNYKLSFFKALNTELTAFLNLVDADTSLVTDINKFNSFIQHFESIVANAPLVVKPDKPLKHLTKVSLSQRELPLHLRSLDQHFYWTVYKDEAIMLRISIQRKKVPLFPFEIMVDMCTLITDKDFK